MGHLVDAPVFLAKIGVGTIFAGDSLFVYFGFMGYAVGDISKLAIQTGLLMTLRKTTCEFLFVPMQTASKDVRMALAVPASLIIIVVSAALLKAPTAYRKFKLPSFKGQFRGAKRLRVLVLLGLGSVLRGFSYGPGMVAINLCVQGSFSNDQLAQYCLLFALATATAPICFAVIFKGFPNASMIIVKAFACFSLPSVALRVWAMAQFNPFTEPTGNLDVVLALSEAFDTLSFTATAVAILMVVGSRWRFIVYICVVGALSALTQSSSFWLLDKIGGVTFPVSPYVQQEDLAQRLGLFAFVPCCLDFICRFMAFFFFNREAVSVSWTWRQSALARRIHASNADAARVLKK